MNAREIEDLSCSQMMFRCAEVLPLLGHSQVSPERSPTFGQMHDAANRFDGKDIDHSDWNVIPCLDDVDKSKVPAGLNLVGDRGIYLMSNGRPRQNVNEEGTCQLVYAIGASPEDEGSYDAKINLYGGDDGCDFLPAETIRPLLEEYEYLFVRFSGNAMEVGGMS